MTEKEKRLDIRHQVELIEAIREFKNAATTLSKKWDYFPFIESESYPFVDSYDELLLKIYEWTTEFESLVDTVDCFNIDR